MSKNLSAKSYQENNEGLQKKLGKDFKIFLKEENEKNNNMVEYRKKILKNEKKYLIVIFKMLLLYKGKYK